MYRVAIDRQLCSGFGSCAEEAPDVFELDDSGISVARVDETDDPKTLAAAKSCPMGAIEVFDSATGEKLV